MNKLVGLMACCAALASIPVHAAGREDAAERCETAVAQTVERVRGKQAHEVQFVSARRSLTTDGDEIGVKGEGRYRLGSASVSFTYSCAFNTRTGTTSGAVFKDTAPSAAASSRPAAQAELGNVSPEACETTVAALLKDKYPRVTGISFRSETRQLRPAVDDRVGLEGRGSLQRAAGMNPQGFGYRCEFDSAGRVLAARETD